MQTSQPDLFAAPFVQRGDSLIARDRSGNALDPDALARAARDEGIHRAIEHANADGSGWSDLAYAFLRLFLRTHRFFISEDVSDASKLAGMTQPPTDRAWGAIYVRAAREKLIVQDGTGRSRRRHSSICPRWRTL